MKYENKQLTLSSYKKKIENEVEKTLSTRRKLFSFCAGLISEAEKKSSKLEAFDTNTLNDKGVTESKKHILEIFNEVLEIGIGIQNAAFDFDFTSKDPKEKYKVFYNRSGMYKETKSDETPEEKKSEKAPKFRLKYDTKNGCLSVLDVIRDSLYMGPGTPDRNNPLKDSIGLNAEFMKIIYSIDTNGNSYVSDIRSIAEFFLRSHLIWHTGAFPQEVAYRKNNQEFLRLKDGMPKFLSNMNVSHTQRKEWAKVRESLSQVAEHLETNESKSMDFYKGFYADGSRPNGSRPDGSRPDGSRPLGPFKAFHSFLHSGLNAPPSNSLKSFYFFGITLYLYVECLILFQASLILLKGEDSDKNDYSRLFKLSHINDSFSLKLIKDFDFLSPSHKLTDEERDIYYLACDRLELRNFTKQQLEILDRIEQKSFGSLCLRMRIITSNILDRFEIDRNPEDYFIRYFAGAFFINKDISDVANLSDSDEGYVTTESYVE